MQPPEARRRSDAGRVRLSGRDVTGTLGPGPAGGQAWWRPERKIRAALPSNAGAAHIADAEIIWPSLDASAYAGQTWAVEVELTPKPAARTSRIMTGLLARRGYDQVIYLASPTARLVVTRAAAQLPAGDRARVAVRDLPASAALPGAVR